MRTTQSDIVIDQTAPTTETVKNVYAIPEPVRAPAPENYLSINEFVTEIVADEAAKAALKKGRRWVADAFYGSDGDTVRTLRLNKGWSQTQLADALDTSQSHVARIERGTENLYIETCRKLCKALGIDMNTLDECLKRQEEIFVSKLKSR